MSTQLVLSLGIADIENWGVAWSERRLLKAVAQSQHTECLIENSVISLAEILKFYFSRSK
jgi:hypothetical protein